MKIIVGEVGSGKTTELIRMSKETGYPILCANKRDLTLLKSTIKYFEGFPEPVSIEDLKGNKNIKEVIIDDVEYFLSKVIGKPVHCASINLDSTPSVRKLSYINFPIEEK